MATESLTAVRERLDRRQRIVRILSVLGILGVLVATAAMVTYLGFTLADIVRQLPHWLNFVGAFLKPDFVDLTDFTQNNGIGGLRAIVTTLTNPGTIVGSIADAPVGSGSVLIPAAITTLIIGFSGTVIGFPLALLFGILGSERVTPFPFNFIFRGTMSSIRAVPALVWILVFIPLAGISPVSAVLAIATDTIGNLGRLFTDELEEIDEGPIEAIQSTGANRPQTVIYGMLSQVSNSFIAWTLYILEINTRIAISLGVVGAGGIGMYISLRLQRVSADQYARAAAGIIVVIIIVITVEMLSSRLRARLRPGEEQSQGFIDSLMNLADGDKWLGTGVDPEDK
jgi:phosphonate transport system permease protein